MLIGQYELSFALILKSAHSLSSANSEKCKLILKFSNAKKSRFNDRRLRDFKGFRDFQPKRWRHAWARVDSAPLTVTIGFYGIRENKISHCHQQVGFNLTDKLPYISLRVTRKYPSPSHHLGTGIIAQARYLIDRDCGRKGGRQYKGQLSFLTDCLPVSDCGGVLLKLILSVRTWLSRF